MFKKNKKGVSPLIATVILIVFAVALGSVVMNWGRGYVGEYTEQADQIAQENRVCGAQASLRIAELGGEKKICQQNTQLNFYVENTGQINIQAVLVNAYLSDGTVSSQMIRGLLRPGYVMNMVAELNTTQPVDQVSITPIVISGSIEIPCSDKTAQAQNPATC